MSDKCTWKRAVAAVEGKYKWYFAIDHPGQDEETTEQLTTVWNFCPYCGKRIELVEKAK
jgi:hypothetical protein